MSKYLNNDKYKQFYYSKKMEIELSLRRELSKEEALQLQKETLRYYEQLVKNNGSKYIRGG